MARDGVTFRMHFSDLTEYEMFVSQRQSGADYNGISRGATVAPAQWKGKAATGECFVCAEPQASCDAGNGVCGLRVKKRSANNAHPPHLAYQF